MPPIRSIDAVAIEQCFELAAARSGDITPLVYERLFARHPDALPLFVRDKTGGIRGAMLQRTIEAIFDFLGPDSYASNFLKCEVVTHDAYGVRPAIFGDFYESLRDTLRDILGPEWTPAMDENWRALLAALAALTAPPAHILAEA